MTARDDLEDAVRGWLGRAYRRGAADAITSAGSFLAYPKEAEASAAVMAAAAAFAAAEVADALGVTQAGNGAVFLTAAEVASRARVSRDTVYRAITSGDLAAVRIGRSYRVPEREAARYLRAGGGR